MQNNDKHEELEKLQEEIVERKKALSKLNEEKESWFSKRAEIGSKIAQHIREVKAKREKRDELTEGVREKKKERRDYSKEIREKISEVKKLRKKRDDFLKNAGIKGNPRSIKSEIEGLELKLQTEPMPYSKEQKLQKHLNDLKEQEKKFSDVSELSKQIKTLSKEIDELKDESDEVHDELQEQADNSQEFHEEVIEKSKYIDDLKKKEDDAYQNFSDLKTKYGEKRQELQDLIARADEIREDLGIATSGKQGGISRKAKEELQRKSDEVEEKVKTGKKLTTEDLLAFQATD